jgi:hypothetical protein
MDRTVKCWGTARIFQREGVFACDPTTKNDVIPSYTYKTLKNGGGEGVIIYIIESSVELGDNVRRLVLPPMLMIGF